MLVISLSSGPAKATHRLAVSALFFLQGLCFASWAARIPSIQQKMGLSDAELGAVLFALPVGLMLSLPLSGWLVATQGSRRIALIGALCYIGTLICIGWAQNLPQSVGFLFLYGVAGNLMNIAVNTQAVGVGALTNALSWPRFTVFGVWRALPARPSALLCWGRVSIQWPISC
ncbi:MFS transporter [Hymenobacter elongatus]|uniref:hypothetical protein n=1 Tax=Hymenobacter elongatus TaxID=877208 RepID=UPI0037439F9D